MPDVARAKASSDLDATDRRIVAEVAAAVGLAVCIALTRALALAIDGPSPASTASGPGRSSAIPRAG